MFEYIKGTIARLKPSHVILEANSVGYFITISLNTYTQLNGKEHVKLFVHQTIREDAHQLYGFADESERETVSDAYFSQWYWFQYRHHDVFVTFAR